VPPIERGYRETLIDRITKVNKKLELTNNFLELTIGKKSMIARKNQSVSYDFPKR